MKYTFKLMILICVVWLGGCLNMDGSIDDNETENKNAYETENYVPIEEYKGEGFTLRDANPETGKIAEEHKEEIVVAVKDYFEVHYKTEVEVDNIVSAVDGVSVFVGSVNEPHFNTFAIIPVDVEKNEVHTDKIRTEEGQVENGIQGGLYAMAYADQFEKLNDFLTEVTEQFPVAGTPQAVIEGVKGNGHTTPYYFMSAFDDVFETVLDQYLENPEITEEELKTFFNEQSISPEGVTIAIELYMTDEKEPDNQVFDQIYQELREQDLPLGEYYLFLNDGFIDKKRAIGKKDNTIEKMFHVNDE